MREPKIYRLSPNLCDLHTKIHRLAYGFFFFVISTSSITLILGTEQKKVPAINPLPSPPNTNAVPHCGRRSTRQGKKEKKRCVLSQDWVVLTFPGIFF